MTAHIQKGEYSAEKDFTVTVLKSSPKIVVLEEAIDEVIIPASSKNGDIIDLPSKTSNGVSITWSCGTSGIISGDIAEIRPQKNGYITLVGEYSYNGQKKSVSYVVGVPFDHSSDRSRGVTSIASDTAVFTDIEGTGLERAAKALSDLGIIKGYEDNTFKPEKEITRAEFAAIMIRTLNYEDIAEENISDTGFADVPVDHWAAGYIKLAKELKLIDGTGSGYEPDSIVTLEQAVKIIVCTLGYRYSAESSGGYPSGYISQAAQLGILKDMDSRTISTDGLDRGGTARLIYNSLEVKLMKEEYTGSGVSYKVSDETLLGSFANITGDRGVVTATSVTSLYKSDGAGPYGIEIDGYSYRTSKPVTNELLGRYVEFFYEDEAGDEVIKSITPVRNELSEVLSDDIEDVSDTYVEYKDGNSNKNKRIKIDKYHTLIYNGREISKFTLPELIPANGRVIFLDNDNDGKSDVIFIEDHSPYIVGSVDVSNNRLILSNDYGCNNQIPTGELDSNGNIVYSTYIELGNADIFTVTSDGEPIEYTALTSGDIISVMVSEDGEYKDIRLIQNSRVTGKVSSVSDDGAEVQIDGTEYKVLKNKNGEGIIKLKSGTTGTFLLDLDGRIFAQATSAAASKNYGYLMSVYIEDSGDEASCKMLTLNDKVEEIRLSSTVSVKYELNSERMSSLEAVAKLTDENGKTKHQLVVYSVNSKGYITSIETACSASENPDFDTRIFTMNCGFDEDNIPNSATNSSYFGTVKQYGGKRLGTRFMTNADTVVFSVPVKSNTLSDGTIDYAVDFSAQKSSYSAHKSLVNRGDYIAAVYDSEKNHIAGAVVVYADSSKPEATVDAESMIAVFSGKITSVNYNDETVEGMKYYVDGVEKEMLLSENYMETISKTGTAADCWRALTVGDTIQFAVNEAGEITDIDYHYLQNPPPGMVYYYTYLVREGGKPNDIMSYIERSRVRDKIGNIVLVDTLPYYLSTTGASAKPTPSESELVAIPYEINTGTIYIIDTKEGRIYPKKADELTDEVIGCDMILQSRYNAIENLVFYKNN